MSDYNYETDLSQEELEGVNFDFQANYTVDGYRGIAWNVYDYVMTEGPDTEWTGEPEVDYDRVVCVMVGDDRRFEFDITELTKIEEDEFCHGCGQVGCGHG